MEAIAATHGTAKDLIMTKAITTILRNNSGLMLISALGFLTGCGDAHVFSLDPGHLSPRPASGDLACFDGAEVELARYSSRCASASANALVADVGEGMEFSAEQVRSLESPCADGPRPAVDVHLEGSSLIFDFANVRRPDRFPRAEFEGFVIDVTPARHDTLLIAATVDVDASSIRIPNAKISHDPERIEVNFAGASYDDDSFVKIDLWFASASLRSNESQ